MNKNYGVLIETYYENTKDVKKKIYKNKDDIIYTFFEDELTNIEDFEKYYLFNMRDSIESLNLLYPDICYKIEIKKNIDELLNEIDKFLFYGNIIVVKNNIIYRFNLIKNISRTISDSISEAPNIMGSRDGFSDSCAYNTALLRTRLKTNTLGINEYFIGKRSKTKVNMFYIKDITNEVLIDKINSTLQRIDIDAILTLSDITTYFDKNRLFQTTTYTGSPDVVASNLLDGQVVIMIDRIPVCIVLPSSLFFLSRIRIDLEAPHHYVFLSRLLVLFSFFMSVFFLGLMASFLTHQQNNLSLIVVTTLKLTQKGALFPINIEILLIVFLFELYQLIGLRSANFSVQTIIVVIAGILIGQSTIEGGLVSVIIMIMTSFAYICTYIISSDLRIVMSLSIMRIIILISSILFGLFGFSISSILLFSYIYHNRFMNMCFLHPILPFNLNDFIRFFGSKNYYKNVIRNNSLNIKDKKRRKINGKKK